MKTIELNRRQFLKTTGALIVSFNLFPSSSSLIRSISPAVPRANPTPLNLTPGSP